MTSDPLYMVVLWLVIAWIGATYLALASLQLNQREFWA
jgi:hypothetical protein